MEILEEFQKQTDQVSSSDALSSVLERSATGLGYRYFSYLAPRTAGKPLSESARPLLLTNYPDEWRRRYLSKCYHFLDPVVIEGRQSCRPYLWGGSRYMRRLHAEQRTFFEEARAFGIVFGMTIPVHGPDGECSFFSVASDAGPRAFQDLVEETTLPAQLLALQVHTVAMEYIVEDDEGPEIRLTDRERECLLWTAQGKTSWEISQIIGRSTATVNYHLQKAIHKLDACNKVQAAFKAYERKLLM